MTKKKKTLKKTEPATRRHRTRLTRKEVAYLADVQVNVVIRSEARWGLTPHKVCVNGRVSYWEAPTVAILKRLGMMTGAVEAN